ncbi:MAG: dephospho-CoA kinase [Elainellaceae cyanobacterium]
MSKLQHGSTDQRRIIGLTGGIGMGKTTVSDYLANAHHLPVLDADVYAREAVEPGSPILKKIVERYGSSILLPNQTLDRVRLGSIVFKSRPERFWLERQIHPFVRDRIQADLKAAKLRSEAIVVVSIPLLFEARMTDLVNEIWVVYCPHGHQVKRLMKRDTQEGDRSHRLTVEEIQSRIDSQMAIGKKLAQADVVLDNSSTVEALLNQVDRALGQSQIRELTPS